MTFTNVNKSASGAITNPSRNVSSFLMYLKHGKEPTVAELANFTFTSVIFSDGTQLQDVTFEQLANATWTLVNKS